MHESVNTPGIANLATLLLMETWQSRLKAHMRETGITQAELAARMKMTQGGIGHWLRGRNEITLTDFGRLCRAAGANPQMILFGTAPSGPELINEIRKLVSAPSAYQLHEPPAATEIVAKKPQIPHKKQRNRANPTRGQGRPH